jgi:DnaK suppressor protein
MTKKVKIMRRGEFLAKVKENLADMKIRLIHEIELEHRAEREGDRSDCMDTSDLACEQSEREISSMLSERDRVKIRQIDDALRRIGQARYGVCGTCGLEITQERLVVMPFTQLCLDCQQDQEREVKTRRRGGNGQDQYSMLRSTDAEEDNNLNRNLAVNSQAAED